MWAEYLWYLNGHTNSDLIVFNACMENAMAEK